MALRPNAGHGLLILDHTQQRTTVGRTPLDEWLARRRDLYLTTHTTLTTDKHPCPRWDSNPRSQQASGHRPTPQTTQPLGLVITQLKLVLIIKNNNECEWDPINLTSFTICTSIFKFLLKYWPDDGLFRPKLVANNWDNKIKIVASDRVHVLFHLLFGLIQNLNYENNYLVILYYCYSCSWNKRLIVYVTRQKKC